MANPHAVDPDSEDASNIMRVISVKNSCTDKPVIVQLIRFNNKVCLLILHSTRYHVNVCACCGLKYVYSRQEVAIFWHIAANFQWQKIIGVKIWIFPYFFSKITSKLAFWTEIFRQEENVPKGQNLGEGDSLYMLPSFAATLQPVVNLPSNTPMQRNAHNRIG